MTKSYKTILGKVLKEKINVRNTEVLQHDGFSDIALVTANNKKFILKSYIEEKNTRIEFRNLSNVNVAAEIKTPKCFGYGENVIVEEYIEGKTFQEIINKNKRKVRRDLFLKTLENLAEIHASFYKVRNPGAVRNIFEEKYARKRIATAIRMIRNEGFDSYQRYAGDVDPSWPKAIGSVNVDKLIKDLCVRSKNFVLGHGDYKPNNIIFDRKGRVHTIDWLGMSKSQPWYDLAYLLVSVPWDKKKKFVDFYLERIKKKGFLTNLSREKAHDLFRSGAIFQQIIRVKSNSHRIKSSKNIHNINEFRAALNGLCEILLLHEKSC